jgi:hypothetical protein
VLVRIGIDIDKQVDITKFWELEITVLDVTLFCMTSVQSFVIFGYTAGRNREIMLIA